jgi:hypothetical protein
MLLWGKATLPRKGIMGSMFVLTSFIFFIITLSLGISSNYTKLSLARLSLGAGATRSEDFSILCCRDKLLFVSKLSDFEAT